VEIASNDGYLLKNFVEAGIPVLGSIPHLTRPPRLTRRCPDRARFFGTEFATSSSPRVVARCDHREQRWRTCPT
jgi:hypothetical protein